MQCLGQSNDYDVVVIDTPPSKNVIDFLDAPQYVTRFLDEKIFKWFVLLDPNRPVKGLAASLLKRTGKIVWEVIGQIFGSDFELQPFNLSENSLQIRYRYEFAPLSYFYLVYTRADSFFTNDDLSNFDSLLESSWKNPGNEILTAKIRLKF